jgi:hypothetical protein
MINFISGLVSEYRMIVGWVEQLFAIPIIGVEMLDGYGPRPPRREKTLHPSYE